jgi:hypothetical protein
MVGNGINKGLVVATHVLCRHERRSRIAVIALTRFNFGTHDMVTTGLLVTSCGIVYNSP